MFKIFGLTVLSKKEMDSYEYDSRELERCSKHLGKAREELTEIRELNTGLASKVGELNETVERKDKEILSSGEALAAAQEKYQKASDNNKKVMSSLKEKTVELAKTKTSLDGLQRENDALKEQNAYLVKEVDTLKSEKSFLEGQVALLQKYGNPEEEVTEVPNGVPEAEPGSPVEETDKYEPADVPEEETVLSPYSHVEGSEDVPVDGDATAASTEPASGEEDAPVEEDVSPASEETGSPMEDIPTVNFTKTSAKKSKRRKKK